MYSTWGNHALENTMLDRGPIPDRGRDGVGLRRQPHSTPDHNRESPRRGEVLGVARDHALERAGNRPAAGNGVGRPAAGSASAPERTGLGEPHADLPFARAVPRGTG